MARATSVDSTWIGTLASGVSIGGTSLTLSTVSGTNWPSSGVFGVQVGDDPSSDAELIQVTRSGTTLTLDASTPTLTKAHSAGANVYLLTTAPDINAKLSLSGGSMTGDLDLGTSSLLLDAGAGGYLNSSSGLYATDGVDYAQLAIYGIIASSPAAYNYFGADVITDTRVQAKSLGMSNDPRAYVGFSSGAIVSPVDGSFFVVSPSGLGQRLYVDSIDASSPWTIFLQAAAAAATFRIYVNPVGPGDVIVNSDGYDATYGDYFTVNGNDLLVISCRGGQFDRIIKK